MTRKVQSRFTDPGEMPAYTTPEDAHYPGLPDPAARYWSAGRDRYKALITAKKNPLILSFSSTEIRDAMFWLKDCAQPEYPARHVKTSCHRTQPMKHGCGLSARKAGRYRPRQKIYATEALRSLALLICTE